MRNLIFVLFSFLIIAGCQSNSRNYKISGTISGLDSGVVYLVRAVNGEAVVIDSIALDKGEFQFKGDAWAPELCYLRLNDDNYFTQFFLENSKIKVEAVSDSLSAAEISGSPATDLLNEYLEKLSGFSEELTKLQQDYMQSMSTGDTLSAEQVQASYQAGVDDMVVYVKDFVATNSSSVVAPFLTLSVLVDEVEYNELKSIVELFPAGLSETVYVKELQNILDEEAKTAIGVIAPDFTQNDPDGSPITLSSLRGKYVLIDFWASWCAPCRQENPNVVANYNLYKDKGFDIIGVSLDRDKDSWIQAIADDNLNWHHVSDLQYWQNEVATLYGVNAIPHSILLDKEGKIIAKDLRGDALSEKLKELMP